MPNRRLLLGHENMLLLGTVAVGVGAASPDNWTGFSILLGGELLVVLVLGDAIIEGVPGNGWLARTGRLVRQVRFRSPFVIASSTSPNRAVAAIAKVEEPALEPPSIMTFHEQGEVQAVRTFWNLYFQPATQSCHTLFRITHAKYIDGKLYWWRLLAPVLARFEKATRDIAEAVADDSAFRLTEVQARLNEVFGAYMDLGFWVAKIAREEGIDLTERDTGGELLKWRPAHEKFREKVLELADRPAQRNALILRAHQDDDSMMQLLYAEPSTPPQVVGKPLTNPPKLVVKHVAYVDGGDDWPAIQFTVLNEGGGVATVGESAVTVWIHTQYETFPPIPPYEGSPVAIPAELGPGAEATVTYKDSPDDVSLLVGDINELHVDTMLLGHIRYTDSSGAQHRVGFCRRRIDRTSNFEAVENADYEYSY